MATDVQVPVLGESITEGTLAEWLKKPGECEPLGWLRKRGGDAPTPLRRAA